MKIAEKQVRLKTGKIILLRSPGPDDAAGIHEHRRIASEETCFMARYPEEMAWDAEKEKRGLCRLGEDPQDFGISAFLDGKLIADCCVTKIRNLEKFRHRGSFGISVRKEFWNAGIGSAMLVEAARVAKENGFEQLELGVFADNCRAIHVYEKAGFQKCGIQPRAFKLKDGTYRDEVMMVLFL